MAESSTQGSKPDVSATQWMTSKQKAALVVISLGADKASEIYKYLPERDIEELTYEVAKIGQSTNSQVEGALDEFYRLCLTHKMMTDGGLDYARNVLEKAFGETTARNLLDKVTKTLQSRPFNFLGQADPQAVLSLVSNERPQVISLILSYLDANLAANVIANLPEDKRLETVSAMAKMDRVSPEAIGLVENEMKHKYDQIITSEDNMNLGGLDFAADVMNNMDRSTEKQIFDEMNKIDADLASDIKERMFVFEDIMSMDDRSIQRFIRECDAKDIVYALKTATDDMKALFFRNMSKRMDDTITSDMQTTQHVRLKDVEAAQQKIVNLIRELEDQGELVINKGGGGDDILV